MNEVLTTSSDGILVITINRPESNNALNQATMRAIDEAVRRLDTDKDLRVGILTGAGGTFSAGGDLKEMSGSDEAPNIDTTGMPRYISEPTEKPLIAAVEGYAVAGGFEFMMACDMAVSARNAKFGLPEVRVGLVAVAGGVLRLSRQIPPRVAMQLAMTGEMISADRAYELGIVNELVDPGSALDKAMELARRISTNAPLAVQASKKIVSTSPEWSKEDMWNMQKKIALPVFESKDAKEGTVAFAEKRQPIWKGE